MKWSIATEEGNASFPFFLTINGARACMRDGRENVVEMAGIGNNKHEIWFKIKDEAGRRMDRRHFEENGSELTEKLIFCKSNGEFVDVLASFGIAIKSRDRKEKGKSSGEHTDYVFNQESKQLNETLPSVIRAKCTDRKILDIGILKSAPPELRIRPINRSWVSELKTKLGSQTVTRIPVIQEKDSECYYTIGGNHLITAVKEAVDEDPQTYQSLKSIDCDIYADISATEARMIAAAHNNMTEVRTLLFQDRVYVARQSFLHEDASDWKSIATETLSLLDGKSIERKNLSLVFFVASLSEASWDTVDGLFKDYEYISPRCSFPQQLFRQLQSIQDAADLNKYLVMARGTSGVKVARRIGIDKQRNNAKQFATEIFGVSSWDEVSENLGASKSQKIANYNGSLSTPEGRQKFNAFLKRLENTDQTAEQDGYIIKLLKDGTDVSDNYKELLKKHAHLLKMEIEKEE